jgi:uncharacterized membrane protein YkvI
MDQHVSSPIRPSPQARPQSLTPRWARCVRVYVFPAAAFQSVIFGGAYGSGREVTEYISRQGPVGGLLTLAIVIAAWSLILGLCFELARRLRTYDYRSFMRALVGPGWIAFEWMYVTAIMLVIAVNTAAFTTISADRLAVPAIVGAAALFLLVLLVAYRGRELLERTMATAMVLLMLVLGWVLIGTLFDSPDAVHHSFHTYGVAQPWVLAGVKYAVYNAAVAPALLFATRDIRTPREATLAAVAAALAGALPALVMHVAFMADYPALLAQDVPIYRSLARLGNPLLSTAYTLILLVMIVQTVAGLLQGLVERVDTRWRERARTPPGPAVHSAIVSGVFLTSLGLSNLGIIELIARGYSAIAWGFLVVFIVPLLTIGVARLARSPAGDDGPQLP